MSLNWLREKEYDGTNVQEMILSEYDRYITLANACEAAINAAKYLLAVMGVEHMLAKAQTTSFDGISDFFFMWRPKYPYSVGDMNYNAEDAYSYANEWGADMTININAFASGFPIQVTFACRGKLDVLVFGFEYIPYNELKHAKIPEWFTKYMKELSSAYK